MSAGEGPLAVPSWAIGVMFTFFLVVALIWAKLLHATEGWLSRHNKPALKRVLHSLKEEILAVGLIVLILPLFQNHLLRICIPQSWAIEASGYTNHGWNWVADYTPAAAPTPPRSLASSPEPAVPPAAPGYLEAAAPGAPTPASADHGAPLPVDPAATPPSDHALTATGRKLLSESAAAPATDHGQSADGGGAGQPDSAKDHGETKVEPGVCDAGWTQLFPADALHGIHIFIALTALVHVFYAGVCLTCCMLRMRFWWPWELEALQSPVVSADKRIVKAVGKSRFLHILMSVANTFILPINRKMYLSMRRLFLEGLQGQGQLLKLEMDFPYHAYVKESMELALCDIITVGPLVWLFAIIQLIIPVTARIYGTIGLCCMAIILMLAASAKLHSIVVHLVTRSNILYGDTTFSTDTQPDDLELGGGDVGRPNDQNLSKSPIAADAAAKMGPEAPTGGLWAKFQGVKDAMHLQGFGGTGRRCEGNPSTTQTSAPALKKRDRLRASVLQRFKTYAVRAKADPDSFPSMFWFNWPVLLLKMFKIAYFQAAFCLTLVLFALWKDNQFLPEQKLTPAIVTFFVLLAINIAMSFFTSASVLPVYALVNVTDKTAFAMAAEFAARAVRHQESMERKRRPTAEPELAQQEHQAAMEVLQRLQSHVGKMRQLIDGVQPFNATTQEGDGIAVSRTTSTADAVLPPSVVQCPEGSCALTPAAAALVWQSSLRSSMVSSPRNRGADLWGSVRTAPWLDE